MSESKTALDRFLELLGTFDDEGGYRYHGSDAYAYLRTIPADAVERIKRLENARRVIEGTMSVCETCESKCLPTCFSYATKMERERNDALGTIVQLEKRAEQADKNVMWVTGLLDEHPEGYDGPCDCGLCRSYGAEDSGLDEEE